MVLKKGNRVCTKGVTLPKYIHFNGSHFHAVEVESDVQNLLLINGRFLTISNNFSANYMSIVFKTEFQTIILRYGKGLNPNWFISYDTKRK